MSQEGPGSLSPWPDLGGPDLAPTIETLHLWSQVVGKVRLMLTPWENHGWHVPLYLSPRGFATGLVPRAGGSFTLKFDLLDRALRLHSSSGEQQSVRLEPQSVSDFHAKVLQMLHAAGIVVRIDPMPSEIVGAVPFDKDQRTRGFDPGVAEAYWRTMLEVHRVLQLFRTRFSGKCSPVHLFWGAFDLAVTRFSGRVAPRHPGGAPHLADAVAREAYSREVSSAGFWPNLGSPLGPCFYSYAYPAPDGFAAAAVAPGEAHFDSALGEFILPYAAVQASPDPDARLLEFLQSTYEAAADLGRWDRDLLERAEGVLGRPPVGS